MWSKVNITSHTIFCVVFFYIEVNMYQLFKDYPIKRNTRIDAADFLYVRKTMLREMGRIVEFYSNSNHVVNGDHLINQLLLQLNVSLSRDLESYVRACGQETERLARAFKLVNPVVNDPKPHVGTFYNSSTKEFIILHASDFDYNTAYAKWKKLVPIKVHSHNFTDTNCAIPDGKYKNSENEGGCVVISINLPMLALQYRAWIEQERSGQDYKDQSVNFIMQYPLTNMVWRHMDIAVINRLINKYRDKPVAKYTRTHSIATVNTDERLDSVLDKRIDYIKKGEYKFDQLFTIFNCLRRPDWMTVLRPIDIAPVRSVKWVLEVQVLNYFEFFLEVRRDNGGRYNGREITRALRDLRNLENDSTYFKSAFSELNTKLTNIKTLLESG